MTDENTNPVLDALKVVRDNARARLHATKEYHILKTIEEAIRKIEDQPTESRLANVGILSFVDASEAAVDAWKRLKPTRPISQGDAAVKAISEADRPMTTKELIDLVRAQGARLGGADPATNLASVLSHDERVHSIPWRDSKAWWLIDRAIPRHDDLLENETATTPAKE